MLAIPRRARSPLWSPLASPSLLTSARKRRGGATSTIVDGDALSAPWSRLAVARYIPSHPVHVCVQRRTLLHRRAATVSPPSRHPSSRDRSTRRCAKLLLLSTFSLRPRAFRNRLADSHASVSPRQRYGFSSVLSPPRLPPLATLSVLRSSFELPLLVTFTLAAVRPF